MIIGVRAWSVVALLVFGCGDSSTTPDAAEIDAAVIDAAGCSACAYGQASAAGTIAMAGATELSGLAVSRALADTVWGHNDSGDTARLFAFTRTGAARGVLTLPAATATDWEDMAIGSCGASWCLYVGDFGDNNLVRNPIRIYEVDEPDAISGAVTATFRAFDVMYPDGPHNAEALFVDPRDGAAYVITKGANPANVYRLPLIAGVTATAELVGSIMAPAGQVVTGGDLFADACDVRLLVRTYGGLFELRAGPLATIAELVAIQRVAVPVASELQGEAVAYTGDGAGYLTVGEAATATLSHVRCD